MKKWIILGATSAIAQAITRIWASREYKMFLVARNEAHLAMIKEDLNVRGAGQIECYQMDANEFARHQTMLKEARETLGGVDGILIAHGTLPDQTVCEQDFELTRKEIETNAISILSMLTEVANQFEQQGYGDIAVISSVAGDRGRQSNYVYGTAKAAVSTFLQGLRNRLASKGVHVLTIKPGFVDTPMTAAFDKGGPLWSTPDQIAHGIVNAIDKRRNVVYVPWFWWVIMTVIRHIPESIFKKMNL